VRPNLQAYESHSEVAIEAIIAEDYSNIAAKRESALDNNDSLLATIKELRAKAHELREQA